MKKINKILISLLIICLPVISVFSYKLYIYYREIRIKNALLEKKRQAWNGLNLSLEREISGFRGEASVVIKDLQTGWEIAFNKDKLMPSASLVKLPILLSYFYAASEGKVSLAETLTVKPSEKVAGSKILGNASASEAYSVEELFDPMITVSDNTATNVLINYMGFDELNAYFRKLDLKNTNLSRKMLDFRRRKQGVENYTTAQDMANLLEELYHKNFISADISEKCLKLLSGQKINDRIPKKLPAGVIVAHKTGLENHVCHDVGIVFTPKGNFLICILARHEDKFARNAKNFIADAALLTYNYYQIIN